MFMPPDEKVIYEEQSVWYLAGHSLHPKPIWGKLLITNRRFAFVQQRVIETGSFLKKTQEIGDVDVCIESSLERVLSAQTEDRPRIFPLTYGGIVIDRKYCVLVLTLQAETGEEHPIFEVLKPQELVKMIQDAKVQT